MTETAHTYHLIQLLVQNRLKTRNKFLHSIKITELLSRL